MGAPHTSSQVLPRGIQACFPSPAAPQPTSSPCCCCHPLRPPLRLPLLLRCPAVRLGWKPGCPQIQVPNVPGKSLVGVGNSEEWAPTGVGAPVGSPCAKRPRRCCTFPGRWERCLTASSVCCLPPSGVCPPLPRSSLLSWLVHSSSTPRDCLSWGWAAFPKWMLSSWGALTAGRWGGDPQQPGQRWAPGAMLPWPGWILAVEGPKLLLGITSRGVGHDEGPPRAVPGPNRAKPPAFAS